MYDLLLKSGTMIDAGQGIHSVKKDVAFRDGRVAAIGDDLKEADASKSIDCTGLFVSPGWIDLHVHVFWGCSRFGIEPDPHCLSKGVTTVLDVGSAGADTFPGFRKFVMETSKTRIYALLHIASQGLLSRDLGELEHMPYANVAKAVEMIEANRDRILGVKVRLTKKLITPSAVIKPLQLAREAADAVGLPLMVHPNDAWCETIDDILAVMKTGDILTHCFHGKSCGLLDDAGTVRDSVRKAADRGVLLDVGHGGGSFSWTVVERALEQGLPPWTISSDLHTYNLNGPVFDLATTASKFLHLGMSLEDVLARITARPGKVLSGVLGRESGFDGQPGTFETGAWGDAVVFKTETGSFDFFDSYGGKRVGTERIVPVTTVRAGLKTE